jgi:hypothetical protein
MGKEGNEGTHASGEEPPPHLNPNRLDALLVMTDASGPELTPVVPAPLSDSYRHRSSNGVSPQPDEDAR